MQSLIICSTEYDDSLPIITLAGQMPYYHKVLINPSVDMQYHLGGYGQRYEEAIIRYVGEGIERYSLMVSQYTMSSQFKYATYNQIKEEGEVIPFEYLNVHSEEDYGKLIQNSKSKIIKPLTKDDTLGWIQCPSLFNKNRKIWVPLQMLFTGYVINRSENEQRFIVGFSKGTASHRSEDKALLSALLEFIEIDACILNWYTKRKSPEIIIDDPLLHRQFPKLFSEQSKYDILPLDLTVLDGLGVNVIGTQLINKKEERPYIVYGAHAGLDPAKCFYRNFMETLSITFMAVYGPLHSPDEYVSYSGIQNFTDLDTNVAYYAHPHDSKRKKEIIYDMVEGSKKLSDMKDFSSGESNQDLVNLLSGLQEISNYGVYLDVTPPEAKERGWHVMRVFIPELLTMCLPGIPYSNHPRILEYGGVKNSYPHPLP